MLATRQVIKLAEPHLGIHTEAIGDFLIALREVRSVVDAQAKTDANPDGQALPILEHQDDNNDLYTDARRRITDGAQLASRQTPPIDSRILQGTLFSYVVTPSQRMNVVVGAVQAKEGDYKPVVLTQLTDVDTCAGQKPTHDVLELRVYPNLPEPIIDAYNSYLHYTQTLGTTAMSDIIFFDDIPE